MNESTDLTADQRAVLSLLLRQRKSYAQIAEMLAIDQQAVRDRAYAAIGTLGSGEGTSLLRSHREEIGDYLLGQRDDLSDSTRSYLLTLANARAWADTVRSELARIALTPLPELPAEEESPTPAPQPQPLAPEPQGPAPTDPQLTPGPAVSKRGGAMLLAAILIVVVVAVILIVNGGGSKSPRTSSSPTASAARTSATSSSGSTPAPSAVHIENQINLSATEPGSSAKGIVEIATGQGKLAFLLVAEGLTPTPTHGFFYAVWLINSQGKARAIGKAPAVSSNGRLRTAELLPSGASSYDRIEITRETNEHTTQPGTVVLSGPFSLHSGHGASSTGSGG